MLSGHELKAALSQLPTLPLSGFAYRFIDVRYLETPLSSGSERVGGRYNIKEQFGALYLSDNPFTALREVKAIFGQSDEFVSSKANLRVLLTIEYSLEAILDITNFDHQSTLGTNLQELTGNWQYMQLLGRVAPTQLLSLEAYNLDNIQALKVPSALNPSAYNLVIFSDRLTSRSVVRVYDNSGTIQAQLP